MRVPHFIRNLIAILTDTYHEWRNDRVLRLGAALAYCALFSIVPFIALGTAAAGLILSSPLRRCRAS